MIKTANKRPVRQLPPTAVPINGRDLLGTLRPSAESYSQFKAFLAKTLAISPEACFLASSGRTVLYYLLKGLKSADPARPEVIIPAYTCPALAKVTLDLGLKPRFVDINPKTTEYESDAISAAISTRTLAIMLVHPFGIPLPFEEISVIAREFGALVIEDAAQAMGAKWDNQWVGTRGDFGLYSLGPGKPISTGGGGVVIANDPRWIPAMETWWQEVPAPSRLGNAQAWLRQIFLQAAFHPTAWWAMTRAHLHRLGNQEASWGYALRDLTASQAATGVVLFPRVDKINGQRRQRAAILNQLISSHAELNTIPVDRRAEAIYLRYPLLTTSLEKRDELFTSLWSAGIGVGRLYEKTLPAIYEPGTQHQYPGAECFARRLLTLPTHHYVDGADLETIRRILKNQ